MRYFKTLYAMLLKSLKVPQILIWWRYRHIKRAYRERYKRMREIYLKSEEVK